MNEVQNIELVENLKNKMLRDVALDKIYKMSAKEFQTRVLDGTLPDFPREDYPVGYQRDTCHEMRLLTEEDFAMSSRACNYAEAHKDKLRYMSVEKFKEYCYKEFLKPSLENTQDS